MVWMSLPSESTHPNVLHQHPPTPKQTSYCRQHADTAVQAIFVVQKTMCIKMRKITWFDFVTAALHLKLPHIAAAEPIMRSFSYPCFDTPRSATTCGLNVPRAGGSTQRRPVTHGFALPPPARTQAIIQHNLGCGKHGRTR